MDEKRHGAEDHICEGCWNDASEPDVLERGKVYFDEHFTEEGPIPRELCSDVEQLLADAIAEIKRLRGELMALVHCGFCGETWTEEHRWCDPELAQLRAITEADPHSWAVERSFGPNDWQPILWARHRSQAEMLLARQSISNQRAESKYRLRALAVVAPKGDTEDVE